MSVISLLSQSKFLETCQSGRPDSYRESMPGKFESVIGDLSEWSNEQAWKVCIRASVSRVRIPQSPH
jgi:hypothetical protein